jgi:ATP-binding cassette subfamily G (WHITE) protein 2
MPSLQLCLLCKYTKMHGCFTKVDHSCTHPSLSLVFLALREAANALLPTYVTICLYFGGLFIVFDKIPKGWEWFSYTSFMRYSWGAFMLNNFNEDAATSKVHVFFDANGNPQTVLEFYGMTDGPIMDSIGVCLGLLTLLLAIFTVLGVLALVYIRHEKR